MRLQKPFCEALEMLMLLIFLSGQRMPIIDHGSNIRPIDQIFEWLDMDETDDVDDLKQPVVGEDSKCPQKKVTFADVQERFLNSNREQIYPWNIPEVPLPTIAESMPDFLRHPNCNMMNDMIRFHQSTAFEDICPDSCQYHAKTADQCPIHFATTEEFAVMGQVSRHWSGTVMLAEAGALAQSHFDTFGFGTYICCAEGEIGFAWSENALDKPDGVDASDRWVYKVLQPGDGVYMDPGRYHLVFRLPGGKQTCGYATRVLRYCDIVRWLEIIAQEIQDAIDYESSNDDNPCVWRGLVISARHLIDQARKRGRYEKFGGGATVRAAERMLDRVENQLQVLLQSFA